jgi:ABC-type uncharacterized transport system permease subunit
MNHWTFKAISFVALTATVVPCLLYFADVIDQNVVKQSALVGTIGWFVATPLWMGRKLASESAQVE